MFLQNKIIAISLMFFILFVQGLKTSDAQTRSQAVRQAQQRGAGAIAGNLQNGRGFQPQHERAAQGVRVAQGSGSRSIAPTPLSNSSPVLGGSPVLGSSPISSGSPVLGSPSGAIHGGISGQPIHGGVATDGQIIHGGSPIISDGYFEGGISGHGCGNGSCGTGACGVGSNYFNGCGAIGGGCGLGYFTGCLFNSFGRLFSNAEFFAGAQGFRSQNFLAGDQLVDDSSFGFYGGINLGVSLRRLTGGAFSGQVGFRSSQSEFEGDFFSTDNRDQLFLTAGIFRRVDHGLQVGAVIDYLYEEWFVETQLAQIRGDVSWVCPSGNGIGFRFALGTEDDTTNGIVNDTEFDNLFAEVIDNYRFYYRFASRGGGHCEAFAGWSEAEHAVLGLDFDMPVNGAWGMQGGFTYFLPEDTAPNIPASTEDAWNVFLGLAIRPQGFGWYRNYDRPLFNVADNGSFVFGRN